MMSRVLTFFLAAIPLMLAMSASPASALTMAECSAKYQAAKAADKLKGQKWNDFRKAECGSEDVVAEPAKDEAFVEEPEAPKNVKAPKGVKFPTKVDKKYASESAGKARMHTCVDFYHANKDAGTLGGLKWIEKGGGFYSLCNTKLKQGA